MIRRSAGRTPPYILVGLVLVIVILGFNYWTLTSQNADLTQELEKLQSEVKISAMKQDQSEKKNAALQETVHEMDSLSSRLNKEIQSDKDSLRAAKNEGQTLKYEITSLKNKAAKMQEQISSLNQQIDDCELDLTKAKETNNHLTTERDDAVEAIAEKDAMINSLKRQLEQEQSRGNMLDISVKDWQSKWTETNNELTKCQSSLESYAKSYADELKKAQDEAAAARREKMAVAKPMVVPGMMNLPGIERKGPQNDAFANVNGAGVLAAPQPILQGNQHGNENAGGPGQAPGAPPVMERPAPPVVPNNKPVRAPIHPVGVEGLGPQNDVLAPPPQHLQEEEEYEGVLPAHNDNLDAAIDEEEKIADDVMDDQDEEGNEIKRNPEVIDRDNIHEEQKINKNAIVGALEVPQAFHPDSFNHQDMNVEDDAGNQGNYYDANFANKIRNLGRPPDIH